MANGIFDIFKSEEARHREAEEAAEIEYIRSRKQVEHDVFDALLREFKTEEIFKMKQAASANEPPTAILRSENQAFSMWYRLPVRGESRATHILDYAIFRGTHRIVSKVNPDFIIECRQLEGGISNRIDPRIIKDTIGLAVDVLPGMVILATNREMANPALDLAAAYGIKIVNMGGENGGRELFELITSDKQTTRSQLLKNLESTLGKIDALMVKRTATPWGKKVLEEKQERLKDRILKELSGGKRSAGQLSRMLHSHEDYVLNELYALEKEKKIHAIERSISNDKETIWALIMPAKR